MRKKEEKGQRKRWEKKKRVGGRGREASEEAGKRKRRFVRG